MSLQILFHVERQHINNRNIILNKSDSWKLVYLNPVTANVKVNVCAQYFQYKHLYKV
jgi:hypothetical protein